jgi:PAS domain S-box-containing protein
MDESEGNKEEMMAALQEAKERYDALFSRQLEAVYICDFDGKFIDANPAALDMLGYSKDEITSLDFDSLLPPDQLSKAFETVKEIIETGSQKELAEYRLRHKDGHYIDIETKGSLIYKNGEPYAIQGTARDITERKNVENAIIQSEEKFRKFFENEPEYCYMVSPKGVILDINKSALEALGYEKEEMIGKPLDAIYAPENHAEMKDLFTKWKETGSLKNEEMTIISKTGERRQILLSTESIEDESGNLIHSVSVQRDITEMKKVQEALQYRLAFEELLANISTHFINLKSEEIDHGIDEALERIGKFVGVDRSYIFLLHDRNKISNTNEWCAEGIDPQKIELQNLDQDNFMWMINQIKSGLLDVPNVADIPKEAGAEKEVLKSGNIKSLISVPILIGGSIIGFLGFDSVKKERTWSNDTQQLIKMTAEICANALERTRSEEVLRESEKKYRMLFENSLEGISITKGNTIVSANKALLDIYGYESFEDYAKIPILDHLAPQSRKIAIERFKDREKGKFVPSRNEYKILRKDRKIRDIDVSTTEMLIGNEKYIQATIRDITDRKNTEELILESESKYRGIVEQSTYGVVIAQGYPPDLVFINEAFAKNLGYTPDDILSFSPKEIMGLVHPEDLEMFFGRYKDRLDGKDIITSYEVRGIHKDQSVRWFNLTSNRVIFKGDPAVQGTFIDITERKKAEEALMQSEAKWRSLAENSPDHIMMLDLDANILYINRTVPDLTIDEVIGTSQYNFLPAEFREIAKECHQRVLETGKPDSYTTEYHTKDGETRYFEARVGPILHNNQTVAFISSSTDITERKKAEQELQQSDIRFRSLIEQTTDSVFCYEYDPPISTLLPLKEQIDMFYKGVLVECNDVCARSYGAKKAEEVIGKKLTELFGTSPGSLDEFYKTFIQNGYRTVDAEGKEVLTDGINRYYLNNGYGVLENDKLLRIWGTFRDITDRKLAEEALKESEEKYRILAEDSPTGIFISNPEKFLYVNNRLCEITGYNSEELLNMKDPIIHLFAAHEHERVMEIAMNNFQGSNPLPLLEAKGLRKNNEEYILKLTSSLIELDGKKVMQGNIEDITESKIAEAALIESQKRLSTAQHIAHLGFWEWDLKTSELYWSDEAYHIYGLEADKINPTYDDFLSILHPDDKKSVVNAVDNAMHGETEFKVDHRIMLPSGLVRFVNSQGELIRDEKGTPVKMMGTMIDITERLKAEEAVRLSEEKYRTLFSKSPEAIVLIGLDGTIIDCNKATEKISGLAREQVIGRLFPDLGILDEENLQKVMEIFQKFFNAQETKPVELELNIAGQKRWIEGYPELLRNDNEPYALQLIIRDITERKLAEKEINQRNEELSTVNTISGTINQTLELKEVLSIALEETISMLKVEGGLIYLTEKSKNTFTPAIYYGFSEEVIQTLSGFSMGEGISGQAAQLGVPLFVPNLAEDAQHISSAFFKDGWESLVSVPLKSKGNVVGVMTVSSRKTERFGPEDIGLLRAIGNQIGVAIENARLFGMTQEELTERRRAERKISEQNKFLKNVLESLTHPFYVVNVKNNIIEVANSAAREEGLSVGSSCHELTHNRVGPCGTDGFSCPIDEIKKTKEPVSMEHFHYDKAGNKRFMEIHAYPIFNEEGEVDRVIESTVDITDRKHAEADLKERDAQLRTVITAAPIVLWSLDQDGKFTLSEGKALDALGLKPGEIVGQFMHDVYKDMPQIIEENKRVLAGEEFSSSLKFANLVWETSYSPLRDQNGKVIGSIGVATDITDRIRAESDREILFRELKHRVKNNLQLLSSMVDMQILRSDDPALKLKLQEIQSVVDTISLIYTRAYEGSQLLGLNLNNFIEELFTALLKFKANDDLQIKHSITGDYVKLNTDQAIPMALVANELIFNAVKHAFNGRSQGNISISINKDEKEITMTIADDGVGIKSDVDMRKPRSFGLKIVKNLIGQLDGTIETQVKDGTKFIIKIPVQKNGA